MRPVSLCVSRGWGERGGARFVLTWGELVYRGGRAVQFVLVTMTVVSFFVFSCNLPLLQALGRLGITVELNRDPIRDSFTPAILSPPPYVVLRRVKKSFSFSFNNLKMNLTLLFSVH